MNPHMSREFHPASAYSFDALSANYSRDNHDQPPDFNAFYLATHAHSSQPNGQPVPYMGGVTYQPDPPYNTRYGTSGPFGSPASRYAVAQSRMNQLPASFIIPPDLQFPLSVNQPGHCCEWVTIIPQLDSGRPGELRTVNSESGKLGPREGQEKRPFCSNCETLVRWLVGQYPGLIIVDTVSEVRYFSDHTKEALRMRKEKKPEQEIYLYLLHATARIAQKRADDAPRSAQKAESNATNAEKAAKKAEKAARHSPTPERLAALQQLGTVAQHARDSATRAQNAIAAAQQAAIVAQQDFINAQQAVAAQQAYGGRGGPGGYYAPGQPYAAASQSGYVSGPYIPPVMQPQPPASYPPHGAYGQRRD